MPLLEATNISKSYAGIRALRNVSFALEVGEVHALVGENGAGKSTLVKIITAAVAADSGEIRIAGERVAGATPASMKAAGIAAIYQQPSLFPHLSVAENIALALEACTGPDGLNARAALRRIDWRARRHRAAALLVRAGARIDPDALASTLTMPQQQMVEIAKAIGSRARIYIMDEPTASLSEREVECLFEVIGQLRAEGAGIIYISHRLDELSRIAQRITVLRDGERIETRAASEMDRAELVRLMVGRDVEAEFPKQHAVAGPAVVRLHNAGCTRTGIRNIDLEIGAGEIVGLAGLVGSGRTEVANMLFGLTPADSGTIEVAGSKVTIDSPQTAIHHRIAYVPEDRRRHGLVQEMSVAENTTLANLDAVSSHGFLDFDRERDTAQSFATRLGTRTASLQSAVATLSGGNQQKVVLSRWLAIEPKLLILDEPTQGIDVGAKAEVHRLISEMARQGMGILLISSELPEILGMSDRIAVMCEGSIAGVLERAGATRERILTLALPKERNDSGAAAVREQGS